MSARSVDKLLGEQVWDRYELDAHANPMPFLLEHENLQSYFLMEMLPSSFPESTWLQGAVLHDYRWRVSYWHDKQHRLSADVFVPLVGAAKPSRAASTLAELASSTSSSSSSSSSMRGAPSSSSSAHTLNAEPTAAARDDKDDADADESGSVYAFNLDWPDHSQQRELNYSNNRIPGSSGMYIIVELVHRTSGVPLSRGSIRVSPQFNPQLTNKSVRISIGSGSSNAIVLDSSSCYDLRLQTTVLPNRQLHGDPLVQTGELPQYNCVITFMRASSSASHWKINRPLVLMPAFVPSPREVLFSDSLSPPANHHTLDQLARPARCYLSIEELQIAPDLLELCSSDRVVLSAHCLGGSEEGTDLAFNPFAVLTPAFLGEMLTNEEGSWSTSSEILLPPQTASVSRLKLDLVGVTIGPDAVYGGLAAPSKVSGYRQQAMELCCGLLTPRCKRLPSSSDAFSSSSSSYSSSSLFSSSSAAAASNAYRGHEEGKGLDRADIETAAPTTLESGVYEVPLFAHPTVVVVGYRNIEEVEPEGIFVGSIVVHVTVIDDGGESPRNVANIDPYLFPTIRTFNTSSQLSALSTLITHTRPPSLASDISDHLVSCLLSPDPLPIWMVHADVGDEMGRKNVYDRLGLVDAVACLTACSRRISSQSSGLTRSLLSPGTIQQSGSHKDSLAVMFVVSHLVQRLSQPGLCDSRALANLSSMIDKSGGSHALWTLFQSWVASPLAQRILAVAREPQRAAAPEPGSLFIPSKDDCEKTRMACWSYRVLGYSQYVERMRGLPIVMARSSGDNKAVTTAGLAEDLLQVLLGFVAPTITQLTNDYAVCVAHAEQHAPSFRDKDSNAKQEARPSIVTVELEKQRCLCIHVFADVMNAAVESASLLLPVAGDLTLDAARALAEISAVLARVPFAQVEELKEVTAQAAAAGSAALAKLLTFLSLLVRQQPSGLDLFQRPAPYVWTKTWIGQASAPRTQHSNVSTSSIPYKRFDAKSDVTAANFFTEAIKALGDFLSSKSELFRPQGGFVGGCLTIGLRDLYCSIEKTMASRVVPKDTISIVDTSNSALLATLPPTARRKRGGAGAAASVASAGTPSISSKADINDIYAQHQAFISKDGSTTIKGLGKTMSLGMRSPAAGSQGVVLPAGQRSRAQGKSEAKQEAPVTVTAVRSLMENGSLQLRSGSFALEGDEAVVYIGERAQFLDCLRTLAVAIGAISEIPCDTRLGLGGAWSAPKSRNMVQFVLNSILKEPTGEFKEVHEARLKLALEGLAQSKGPSGSYFVLLLVHISDVVDLYWKSTTAFVKGTGTAEASTFALPHSLVPRTMQFDKAQLPILLARDVELLTQVAQSLFARVNTDEALSVAEVRAFNSAQKHRAAATQDKSKGLGIDEKFLLSGGDVCAISSWLRLRRHLMDAVVGVLRAGIRLGLFEVEAVLAHTAAEAREKLHSAFARGSISGGGKAAMMQDSFMQRLQALTSLAEIASHTPTRQVSANSFSGTPLNCLVWLLRDLADMEPLQRDRQDLALLCLQSNDDAKRTLTTLFSIAVDLPVLPASSVASTGAIAKVLNLAREDLMGGCINVMQIMSVDVHTSPLTLEPYFQSLLDECIANCVPPSLKKIFDPSLTALLKSSEPLEPSLVNSSPDGYAAAVSSLLRILTEPEAMRSKALWKMSERLTRRLTAVRMFVLARAAAIGKQHPSLDKCEHSLRSAFSLVASGAALQTLLHMAPKQKGRGGWGLDVIDRKVILTQLTSMTPITLQGGAVVSIETGGHTSVLDHPNPFRSQAHGFAEEDLFDPLRSLGTGHRAGQALLELTIGETITLEAAEQQLYPPSLFSSPLASEYGEDEHRRGRAALTCMLNCGEWETGVSVAASLAEQCSSTQKRVDEALTQANDRAATTILSAESVGSEHAHSLLLRSKRQAAISAELAKAHDKLQQRLVHDGPLRPLPIYFALRFLENPWIDAEVETGMRAFLEATDCHVTGFSAMSKVHASEQQQKSKTAAQEADPGESKPGQEEPAPEGIGRGIWILLRCDPTSFSRNAEVYADLAERSTEKLLKRSEREKMEISMNLDHEESEEDDDEDFAGDRVHVPLPSSCSTSIQAQLLRAFPAYQMLPPITLVEPDMMSDRTHPRAMQLFQAFPAALCMAADAGLGSSETVGVSVTTSHDSKANSGEEGEYADSAIFKAHDSLKKGDQPECDWEVAMHADTFFVFASLDRDSELTEQSKKSDCGIARLTLSTVSAIAGARASAGHGDNGDDGNDNAEEVDDRQGSAWAGHRRRAIERIHALAPASLLFLTDARRLSAFEAGMSVIRHQLQALNRVHFALSNAAKLSMAEVSQQSSLDVTSNCSIMAAALGTVANMIMVPSSVCVGVHNARALVAGESDRLETLWHTQRKAAKRDYMRKVSAYEADLKDAVDYGFTHPEPPEDPDFSELEDLHQMARLNLERLSARRISCVLLIESILQSLRVCSLVIPSRLIDVDIRDSMAASLTPSKGRPPTAGLADDLLVQLDVLTDIADEDEFKVLWLQLTLWLESAVANLDGAVV